MNHIILNSEKRETEFILISSKGVTIEVLKKATHDIYFLYQQKNHGQGIVGEAQYHKTVRLDPTGPYISYKLEYRGNSEIEFKIKEE